MWVFHRRYLLWLYYFGLLVMESFNWQNTWSLWTIFHHFCFGIRLWRRRRCCVCMGVLYKHGIELSSECTGRALKVLWRQSSDTVCDHERFGSTSLQICMWTALDLSWRRCAAWFEEKSSVSAEKPEQVKQILTW